MNQGCFLPANKSTCTVTQLYIKIKIAVKNIFTQHTIFICLLDGNLQALNSQGIFSPDVYQTLVGAGGISAYGHGFQNSMWIAFQDGAVHERTRVPLVGITY